MSAEERGGHTSADIRAVDLPQPPEAMMGDGRSFEEKLRVATADYMTGDPLYDEAFLALAACPSFTTVQEALRKYTEGLAQEICEKFPDPNPLASIFEPDRVHLAAEVIKSKGKMEMKNERQE